MNHATLLGILEANAEYRFTSSNQTPIAKGVIKLPEKEGSTQPFRISFTVIGKQAEPFCEVAKEGKEVLLQGRIELTQIEREGYKEYRPSMIVSNYHIIDSSPPFSLKSVPDQSSQKITSIKEAPSKKSQGEDSYPDDIPF